MYTEVIGRRFLRVWQARTGEVVSGRAFFDEYLYPLFFASEKLLQWVPNSPFAQKMPGPDKRNRQRQRLHELINAPTMVPDASFAVGFPAAGTTATTAGQASDRAPATDAEGVYCSWIGAALGIGVAGGLSLLLTDDDILWTVHEGWAHYRSLLDKHPAAKGNQIDTWNGQWLAHALSDAYYPPRPLQGLDFAALLDEPGRALRTHSWVALLFQLARQLPEPYTVAYVYALGQTNRTVGFIPVHLAEIRDLRELAHRLFDLTGSSERWHVLSAAYETRLGLAKACEAGSLGLMALEPARLREVAGTAPARARTPAAAAQQEIYLLWLSAMLHQESADSTDLSQVAATLAHTLRRYAVHEPRQQQGRGKTRYAQLVEQVFVRSVTPFVAALTQLLEATSAAAEYQEEFLRVVALVSAMPPARFTLFMALLRFRYVATPAD